MKKQPKNKFDPQRNQKATQKSAMASLSKSVPDNPLQVGKAQADPNLDKSKVDYGTTTFGRGANQVGDNPSAQLANAMKTLQNAAVSVVDTAHKFDVYKDGEVDAARQEELRDWALANPNADEAAKIKQAAVINGRYERQYNLTSSKRALDAENFKLSASLPGAEYKDFERDYVYKRGQILTNSEMKPEAKAEALKTLNDTFLETGLKEFGDSEEYTSAIYRTVVEGRNENQERITRTVRKNLRMMGPRITEEIDAVISEIGAGNHMPMNRAELAKLISDRAGVPEEMQSELFLEQFNMYYREQIDKQYASVDAAFKARVKEANDVEVVMTEAAVVEDRNVDPDKTSDYYAAIGVRVADSGADARANAFYDAVAFTSKQYATKYTKGASQAEGAWEAEVRAQAEQFGLDPQGKIVNAAILKAKAALGPMGFSAHDRAMAGRDQLTLVEIGKSGEDWRERRNAQMVSTENAVDAVISHGIKIGIQAVTNHAAFAEMSPNARQSLIQEASNLMMQARLSQTRDGKPFAHHMDLLLQAQGDPANLRAMVGIMNAASPDSGDMIDGMSTELGVLRDGGVLDFNLYKKRMDQVADMGIHPDPKTGKLVVPADPGLEEAHKRVKIEDGSIYAQEARANGVDLPNLNDQIRIEPEQVEVFVTALLSDPDIISYLMTSDDPAVGSDELRAEFLLKRASEAMGTGNGFDTNTNSQAMIKAVRFLTEAGFSPGKLMAISEAQKDEDNARVGVLVNELNEEYRDAFGVLAESATANKVKGTSTAQMLNDNPSLSEAASKADRQLYGAIKKSKASPEIQQLMLRNPDLRTPEEVIKEARAMGLSATKVDGGNTFILTHAESLEPRQNAVIQLSGEHADGGRALHINQQDFRTHLIGENDRLQAIAASLEGQTENPDLDKLTAFYATLLGATSGDSAALIKEDHSEVFHLVSRVTAQDGTVQVDGPTLATYQALVEEGSFLKKLRERYHKPGELKRAIRLISLNTRWENGQYEAVVPADLKGIKDFEVGQTFPLNSFGRNYAAVSQMTYVPNPGQTEADRDADNYEDGAWTAALVTAP